MLRYTRFVWILLYAQLLFCVTTAWFSEAAALHHHEETSSVTKGLIRSPDNGMHTPKNVNGWCRRCLRIQEDEAPPPVAEEAPPPAPVTAPPVAAVDLPALPTDPDAPPSPRTNPSSLLITPSGTSAPGLGDSSGSGSNMKPSSVLAGKVGFSAGVGLTAGVGLGVLLLGVLYYFKPDLFFLCCKTCVRVQVFHHSAPANANSKK